jgi:AcrR family transcriptional regulator
VLPTPSRPRRTQEQRSAETRRRILEATVQCLQDYGYTGTTTVRVVELAGVSRGALAHQFESKADMVAAAVGFIASTRTEELIPKIEAAQGASDPIDAGLDLLWSVHQGPMFIAIVELWVAARTDPALQRRVEMFERATTSMVVEYARTMFGGTGTSQPALRRAIYTAMDAIRGILLAKIALPPSSTEHEARWERAKADLRVLFDRILTGQPGRVTPAGSRS